MSGKTITNKFSLTAVVDGRDMGRNLLRNAGDLTPTAVRGGGMSLVRDDGDTTETYQGRTVSHFDNGGGSAYKDVLSWLDDASVIEKGGTYTLSFLCKGTGALQAFLYSSSTGTASDLSIYRVGDDGAAATKNDGNWAVSLSGTWARRHVTWRVDSDALPQRVLIRATAGSEVYVCQPKLEEGGDATAFCLNEADLVGNGIAKVTEHYLASASKTGVTTSTDGWTADPADAAISYSKPYLWNYETVTYTDGTTADTAPSLIGSYGGKGISKITEYYLATNSTTAPTDGWQTTVQQVTSDNKYLWNYETVTYTDGSTDKTDPAIIGTYGRDGTSYATNLLLNSANFDAAPPTHWETWGGGVTALSLERIDGENSLAMSLTGDTEHYGGVMQTRVDKAYFRSGDKVALGFDAKGGTPGTQTIAFIIHFRPVGGSTVTAQVYRTLTVDSVMRRYTFAFDVPSAVTGTAGFCLMLGNTPSTGAKSVTIGRVKLEANDGASPWSPNPEDLRGPQGDKGDDAVVMVMDNEADSVPCDSAGVVTEATDITTRVWLYKGAKPLTSGITAPTDGGITLGGKTGTVKGTGDGGYALTWSFAKGDTITGGDRQAATVTLGYSNATYTSVFTLNVVRSGAAGVSPTLHRLMPSLTALSFARDSDGNLTPKSLTLSCGFSETKDGVTTSYAGTDDRVLNDDYWGKGIVAFHLLRSGGGTYPESGGWFNMWNSRTEIAGLTYNADGILEIAADSDITAVEFVYAPQSSNLSDSDIIDRETVPVVREGARGADITKTGEEIRYVRSASGTETPGEDAAWQEGAPDYDSSTPYLWTRSVISFSSGDPVTSYSVARQAKDGDNGKALLVSSKTRYAKGGKPSTDAQYGLADFPDVSEGETVWSVTITTYTDPDDTSKTYTTRSYGCYRIGKDGDKGAGVHIAYATNVTGSLKDGYPTNDNQVTGFQTEYFSGAVWIGVCVSTDTDDPQDKKLYQWSRMRGENGKDGTSVTMQGSAYGVDCLGLEQGADNVFTPELTAKEGMTALDVEGEDDGVATRACILKYTGGAWEVQDYLDAGVYVLDKNGKEMYLVKHNPDGETEYDTRASSYTPTAAEGFLVDGDLWFYSVAQQAWTDAGTIQGPQGPQGPKGNTGGTGRGISSVDVIYCLDNNGSAPSKPTVAAYSTEEWNTDPSTFVKSDNKTHSLWQCTRTEYTDGKASYTTPQKVGDIGDMATVTELYTSVEDGETPTRPGDIADPSLKEGNRGDWYETDYTPEKGKWTWTCSEIVWLAADSNGYMVTYTTPQKASYTPKDGETVNGEDAVVLDTSPAAIVWNEEEGSVTYDTTTNQYKGTPTWPEIPIVVAVRTGGVAQAGWTFEPSVVSGSYSLRTVTAKNTYTDSDGNEATVQTNEVVYILHTPTIANGSSELWTNGSFRVTATKDGKELIKNVPIALNALGTWKLNVVNDSMTATASKTETQIEEALDGKGYDTTIAEMKSEIQQKAEEISTRVEKTETGIDGVKTQVSEIQQTADRISLKVSTISTERNILPMSSPGTLELRNGYSRAYTDTVTLKAGMTYTVTWQGYIRANVLRGSYYSTRLCQKVRVYKSSTVYAESDTYDNTTATVRCFKFTATEDGEYVVEFCLCNADGSTPDPYYDGSVVDWLRVDAGDYTGDGDTLSKWEPSEADTEAVNLLPDHTFTANTYATYSGTDGRKSFVVPSATVETGATAKSNITTTTDGGVPCVRFKRLTSQSDTNKNGLRWYAPFRGAGSYTLSASFKNMRTNSSTDTTNKIVMEMHPCDASFNRIHESSDNYNINLLDDDNTYTPTEYGWSPQEMTRAYGDTETGTSGAVAVGWIEIDLYMTGMGDMEAGYISLSKCGHATAWNAQELSSERAREAVQLATGIDIYSKKIVATGDRFEWRDNSGNRMAYFDTKDGAVFNGTVRANNFYHRVCVWGVNTTYYVERTDERTKDEQTDIDRVYSNTNPYPFTPGTYITEEEATALGGEERVGLVECTGYADIVIVPGKSRTVTLPRAEDMEGKIVEIYDGGKDAGSYYVEAVDGKNFTLGITYNSSATANSDIDSAGYDQSTLTITAGSNARFYSVDINGTCYWLRLE